MSRRKFWWALISMRPETLPKPPARRRPPTSQACRQAPVFLVCEHVLGPVFQMVHEYVQFRLHEYVQPPSEYDNPTISRGPAEARSAQVRGRRLIDPAQVFPKPGPSRGNQGPEEAQNCRAGGGAIGDARNKLNSELPKKSLISSGPPSCLAANRWRVVRPQCSS